MGDWDIMGTWGPVIENQMEREKENEMGAGAMWG